MCGGRQGQRAKRTPIKGRGRDCLRSALLLLRLFIQLLGLTPLFILIDWIQYSTLVYLNIFHLSRSSFSFDWIQYSTLVYLKIFHLSAESRSFSFSVYHNSCSFSNEAVTFFLLLFSLIATGISCEISKGPFFT